MSTYLMEAEMNSLMEQVRFLRKGHKLHPGAKAPYLVKVDDAWYDFKQVRTLRKFLEQCTFPEAYRVFRNADKGITINLDV